MREDLLFYGKSLWDLLHQYPMLLAKKIEEMDRSTILNTSLNDIADHLMSEFRVDIPRLRLDEAHQLDPKDEQIDVSHDISRAWRDAGPHYLQGTLFTLAIPFDGDPDLLGFSPSTAYMSGIHGEVRSNHILLKHRQLEPDGAAVKRDFENRIQQIQSQLETQRQDVQQWNAGLPDKVRGLLEARKKKVLDALKLAESLTFPIKKREGATYAVPVTRKRIVVEMPKPKVASYAPEPELTTEAYEDILRVISSLAIQMERSPSAFATLGEEFLRDHILVNLNGQFEGGATGETFNRSGKTDILIREKGRNVFIGECKFWDGPKSLTAAIDQVLSYASWRDTKIAVIVFNRRKDISAVLAAIPDAVAQHPSYKKRLDYKVEGAFRFLFGQKDDRNRDVILTVLVFDVPGATDEVAPPAPAPPAAPAPAPVPAPPRPPRSARPAPPPKPPQKRKR